MKTVAIIPARGGSKRIPRKNIKPFCGKPMISWSIKAAQDSKVFDAIIVSTDDEEIAQVARDCGAEAPFKRPPELSGDHALTLPVIAHAIHWFEENRGSITCACCIYATDPFLEPNNLRAGLEVLQKREDAEFAFGVTSYAFPIFRALQLKPDGSVGMFWPENELKRSQDLPPAFHDAGQFYWGRKEAFLIRSGIFSARSLPIILPRHSVQDIDTPEDWERAEQLFRLIHKKI